MKTDSTNTDPRLLTPLRPLTLLRRLTLSSLAPALLFACASTAGAQETRVPKRPSGPVAGPVITLPAGQGESAVGQAEPSAQGARAAHAPRWEYCAITGVNTIQKDRWSPAVGAAHVRYFGGGPGEQFEGATEDEALANAMSRLGDEGWELVAIRESVTLSDGFGASTARYFFKRPKRGEVSREQDGRP